MKKVMLADDEEEILELLSATLRQDDKYHILFARDGDEAVNIAKREKPDILFLDIMMPKRNGHEVCRILKQCPDTAHIKVIMLTALTEKSARKKALKIGADDYFTKPFSPTALLSKVISCLEIENY